jgi:hypothetical protein
MRGGTFNLRYGRNPDLVREEVINLLDSENLDFLGCQETNDYIECLRGLPGYRMFTGHSVNGGAQREVVTIVRSDHKVSKVQSKAFGDGWPGQGFRMRPRVFLKLVINDKHSVANCHMPPRTNLRTQTPVDRYDDYEALARRARRYFKGHHKYTRTLVSDFNTWPSNKSVLSPSWIADMTGAELHAPDNKLDYVLTKGLYVPKIRKIYTLDENSDHNPVVFLALPKVK